MARRGRPARKTAQATAETPSPTHGPQSAEVDRRGARVGPTVIDPATGLPVGAAVESAPPGTSYQYDADGRLTREGMEAAHRDGRTVLHAARPIMPGQALPSPAELAGNDPRKQELARQGLAARRAELDREEALLDQRSRAGKKTDEDDAPPPPDARVRDDDGRPLVSGAVASTRPEDADAEDDDED